MAIKPLPQAFPYRWLAALPSSAEAEGQGRLGDVALLGGARKIQRLAHGEKVADLVHLHGDHPSRSPDLLRRHRFNAN
jgi:tRNA U34 5-methylaminomethyl-2-thiouridine-forming methyltransferase MnmC